MPVQRYFFFLFIAMLLACTFTTSGLADPSTDIKKALKLWQPQAVTMEDQTLQIITRERMVTDTIFKAVIESGVCAAIWMGNSNALDDVKEIAVLNKFGRQGYVFEGGKKLCDEMGKLKAKDIELYLLGHTHLF